MKLKKKLVFMALVFLYSLVAVGCTKFPYFEKGGFEKCKLCEKEDKTVSDTNDKEKGYCESCWNIKLKLEKEHNEKKDKEVAENKNDKDTSKKESKEKNKVDEKKEEKREEVKKEQRCKDCKGEFMKGKAGQEELGICFNCQGHYCYSCGVHISEKAFNETCDRCEPKIYCKQCKKGTKDKNSMHLDRNGDNICSACCEPRQGECVLCGKKSLVINGICEWCHEKIVEGDI